MASSELGLRRDFVAHFVREDAWPKGRVMQKLLKVANKFIGPLMKGDAVPAYVCEAFCAFLVKWHKNRKPERKDEQWPEAAETYLAAKGLPALPRHTAESLLDALCEPREPPAVKHWWIEGISALARLLPGKRFLGRYAQRCQSKQAIKQATRWVFVAVGADIKPQAMRLGPDEVIPSAEAFMGVTTGAFEQCMRTWIDFHPWTAVLARGDEVPTGVSIVLPLTADAYDRVRRGELMTTACTPGDFEVPSRHIFIDTMAQRPRELKGESVTTSTKSLLICTITQIAVLTQFSSLGRAGSIKMMSIAVTREGKQSLRAYGYKPVGKTMQNGDIELYERSLPFFPMGKDLAMSMLLTYMHVLIGDEPPQA